MKAFAEMTKEEIAENFSNRWNVEGYRAAIENLAELEKLAANGVDVDTYYAEIDRIADEYGQGINTVAFDTARL